MVYLVHHAEAVAADVDAQRSLSMRGRTHVERLAADAAARGVKPAAIWHSGKMRARQTAEAFLQACNPLAQFAAIRGLQPDDPPAWIRERLADEIRDVMLVGHMPHLPRALTLLVTGGAAPLIEFPQHGLVALKPCGGRWEERWRLVRT